MRFLIALMGLSLVLSACSDEQMGSIGSPETRMQQDRVWTRLYTDVPGKLRGELAREGYDITGSHHRYGFVDVLSSPDRKDKLLARYARIISWVENLDMQRAHRALSDYYDPAEVETFLDAIEASYPAIAKKVLLQSGLPEGHSIYAMKISDNVDVDEPEHTYLMDGQTHAREVMTVEVMVDAIEYLTSNYGSDPQVTRWVDELEIWIVPIINPDGLHYVHTVDDYWRKNRSHECGTDIGVDLNRNFAWNYRQCSGSDDYCSGTTYHGTGPASELETQAMQALMEELRPQYYINYHSSGEYIIWPTACGRTEEQDMLGHVGQALNQRVETDDGQTGNWTIGTCPDTIGYTAPGGADDHAYGAAGSVGFTIELNHQFHPDYDTWRDATCVRQRAAWGHLLDRTLDSPAIRGFTYDANTLAPIAADYQYASQPFESGQWPLKADHHGRFGRPTLPDSDHILIFTAPGYLPESRVVHVNSGPVDLDVPMTQGTNHAPVAVAGSNQIVNEADVVNLDGSGSYDPDGNSLLFAWNQTGGTPVVLQDAHSESPSFTAPFVGADTTLTFELIVSDGELDSAVDSVEIQVIDIYPSASYVSDDTPMDIPDNDPTGIVSTIHVPDDCTILQISVQVDITHTYIGDLSVTLQSPEGTQVILHDNEGGSTEDIHEIYQPTQFNGESATGDWTLTVVDSASIDTGTLDQWILQVECVIENDCVVPGDCDLINVDEHGCVGGQCTIITCDQGYQDCDGLVEDGCEIHTESNPDHCGGCGVTCDYPHAEELCNDGTCEMGACLGSWANCDGQEANGCEIDTGSDVMHCGDCITECAFAHADADCVSGSCELDACQGTWRNCNGEDLDGCEVDTDSDLLHCGDCVTACDFAHADTSCVSGACVMGDCQDAWQNCDGQEPNGCEVDTGSDLDNCGGCGSVCSLEHATESCQTGTCTLDACDQDWGNCDAVVANGCETDLQVTEDHCGACDHTCTFDHASGSCTGGNCNLTGCDANWGNCDDNPDNGCETYLVGNIDHCQSCDNACDYDHAAGLCTDQGCQMGNCDNNWGNCDGNSGNGCEINLLIEPAHCGGCNNPCAFDHAGSSCVSGGCVMGDCDSGWADCDQNPANGCETALGTDTQCTSCTDDCTVAFPNAGGSCQGGTACAMGECVAFYGDCNQSPVDGCEMHLSSDNHCGACGVECGVMEVCIQSEGVYICTDGCHDADDDSYADDACGGDDCDDADDTVYPGAAEACDGKDNDCDDTTDEEFPALGEACDGPDEDVCVEGVLVCNPAGDGVACSETGAGHTETCNGIDDDCDGGTDELWPTLGEVCDGEDADACAEGSFVCNPAGDGVTCQETGTGHEETCNQLDDDCDGETDEEDACGDEETGGGGCGCASQNRTGSLLLLAGLGLLVARRRRKAD